MDEPINAGRDSRRPPPPELGNRLLDLLPIVIVGTVVWLVVFIVLLATGNDDVWLFTTLSGTGLGLIGMPLIHWQRVASRKGSRGAQRDL